MSVLKTTALILTFATLLACKRTPPKAAVLHRPPDVPGPTSQEIVDERLQTFMKDLEPFTPLEQTGTVFETPDKEQWVRYSNGIMIHEIKHVEARKPAYGQTADIVYTGTYPGSNKIFDGPNKPLSIVIGSKSFIKGLSIALNIMPVGSKWRIFIPADLAYGVMGNPMTNIPGNQPLIFEVEMKNVTGESLEMPKIESVQDLTRMGPATPTEPATSPAPPGTTKP